MTVLLSTDAGILWWLPVIAVGCFAISFVFTRFLFTLASHMSERRFRQEEEEK